MLDRMLGKMVEGNKRVKIYALEANGEDLSEYSIKGIRMYGSIPTYGNSTGALC